MCNKVILEKSGTLNFIADCYKNRESCYNAVDNHFHALQFVPDFYQEQVVLQITSINSLITYFLIL